MIYFHGLDSCVDTRYKNINKNEKKRTNKRTNKKQTQGFTLVEILIVICILSAMSFFLVQNFTKTIRATLIDQSAATVLDIKRASLSLFVSAAAWPDQVNGCLGAAEHLRPIIGPIGENPWGFAYELHCPSLDVSREVINEYGASVLEVQSVRPSLQVQQQVPSGEVAMRLAGRLPSSEVRRQGQSIFVVSYIPMALLPSGTDHSNQVTQSATSLTFRVIYCPPGQRAETLLMPADICVNSNDGLFGFRLGTENIASLSGSKTVLFDIQDGRGQWVNGFTACPGVRPIDAVRIYQYCTR